MHPRACSAHPLPDGRALALYRDLDRTADELNAARRGDGDAWRAFVGPMLDSFDAVRATMLSGFPPLVGPVKLLRSAGPMGLARFAALLPGSHGPARTAAVRQPRRARGSTAPPCRGRAAHRAGSAIAVAYLNLLGHAVGWPSPRRRAGLTDALVGYLVELGGRVRTGALVTGVEAAHGRVTGVRLAGASRSPPTR